MEHREAARHLTDLVDGTLDAGVMESVSNHVDQCQACRGWVDTYKNLARDLDPSREPHHPDSQTLAWYAVSPEEIHESERGRVAEHLERCDDCRGDLEDIRSAVVNARPPLGELGQPTGRQVRWRRLAAAAAVVVAVGLITFVMRPGGPWGGSAPDAVVSGATTETIVTDGVSGGLSDVEIAGTRLIEGGPRVTLERVMIAEGADVTIRAGDTVAFGNGFRVGNRARLHVTAGNQRQPATIEGHRETAGRDS